LLKWLRKEEEPQMAKTLIVDDEKDLAEMLKDVLELEGHKVVTAKDGYQAIEEAKKIHYDLILMDIRLPGMNGVETFLEIKGHNPSSRVIMMTGFSVEDLIQEAIEKGAYACIHKPFDMSKVIPLIEKALKTNQGSQPVASARQV
jgi:DNA-binding NtrC family response regulator